MRLVAQIVLRIVALPFCLVAWVVLFFKADSAVSAAQIHLRTHRLIRWNGAPEGTPFLRYTESAINDSLNDFHRILRRQQAITAWMLMRRKEG